MKAALLTVIAILTFLSGSESSQATEVQPSVFLRTHDIRACDYWSRDPDTNGYVCNFYPTRINVADGRDTEQAINSLERTVSDLERRVAALEQLLKSQVQ